MAPTKRFALTFEQKGYILDRLDRGVRVVTLAAEYGVNESTIRTIRRNKDKIHAALRAGNATTSKSIRSAANVVLAKTEKLMLSYLDRQGRAGIGVDNKFLRKKAVSFYSAIAARMNVSDPQPFQASRGWLHAFKRRHNLHRKSFTGETVSADATAAKNYPEYLRHLIDEEGYTRDQIYNADETGLQWKKMPHSTYIACQTKKVPGRKPMKDRFTLLFCCNASGSHKMMPVVVHKSLNPRSYANVPLTQRGVIWYKNSAAWMTQAITNNWFDNHFVPAAEARCRRNKQDFRVLLILDNAPGHSHLLDGRHPNVKVIFLPPNTTSLLQPLDQELIAILKGKYYHFLFQNLHQALDDDVEVREEFDEPQAGPSSAPDASAMASRVMGYWRGFTIRQAIDFMLKGWDEVSEASILRAWCPLLGVDRVVESEAAVTTAAAATATSELVDALQATTSTLPGFEEVGREELMGLVALEEPEETTLDDLLQDEEEEMEEAAEPAAVGNLPVSELREVLSLVATLRDKVSNMDCDRYRASQVVMSLTEAFGSYRKLFYDHVNSAQQRNITEFFRSRAATAAPPSPAPEEEEIDDMDLDAVLNDTDDVVSSHNFCGFAEEGEGEADSSSSQE